MVWAISWALARPPAWIEAPDLTADPKVLLREAQALESEYDLVVLLDEDRVHYDAEGRRTVVRRLIWQARDASVFDDWGSTVATWSPWRADRPTVQARVIQPDGTVVFLDPSTLVEGAASQDPTLLDDRRTATAPLPGLVVGSVIEETTTTVEREPFLGTGSTERLAVPSAYADAGHRRVVVDVDTGLSFDTELVDSELKLVSSRTRDTRGVSFYQAEPERTAPERYLPSDVAPWPYLRVTTQGSWSEAGAAYHAMVAPVLDPEGLEPWIEKLRALPDDTARIDAAYRIARDELRYTGLELGANAIVPYPPARALERGYGDCKDKAALMITLLAAVGIEARFGLLDSGFGWDVTPEHVSPRSFDHAIVYVPSADRWLDPTDGYRPANELPSSDQGRMALVPRPGGGELKRIPVTYGATRVLTSQVQMPPVGRASYRYQAEPTGWLADESRDDYWDATTQPQLDAVGKEWVESFGAKLIGIESSPVRDVDTPFRMTIELDRTPDGETGSFDAIYQMDLNEAFEHLPSVLVRDDSLAEREVPLQIVPFKLEESIVVQDPRGFEPDSAPEPVDVHFGPVHYQRSIERADGVSRVEQRLDTGHGRLTPAEAEALRSWIVRQQEVPLHWIERTERLAREHRYAEGFAALRADREADPTDPRPWVSQSWQLEELGFRDRAIEAALEALKLAPDRPWVHRMLALQYNRDPWGRLGEAPYLRDLALARYKDHLLHEPELTFAQDARNAAILQEKGRDGVIGAPGADLGAAIELMERYESVLDGGLSFNHVQDLLRSGRCDEAAATVERLKMEGAAKLATDTCRTDARTALARYVGGREERVETALAAALVLGPGPYLQHAADLYEAVAASAADPEALHANVAQMRKGAKGPPSSITPESIYQAMYFAAEKEDGSDEALLARAARDSIMADQVRAVVRSLEFPVSFLMNSVNPTLDIEGSRKHGWHVTVRLGNAREHMLLVREEGEVRLRAWGLQPQEWAEEARARIAAGDLAGVRQWLAWCAALGRDHQRDTSAPGASFVELYTEPRDLDDARALVGVLHNWNPRESEAPPPPPADAAELAAMQAALRSSPLAQRKAWAAALIDAASLAGDRAAVDVGIRELIANNGDLAPITRDARKDAQRAADVLERYGDRLKRTPHALLELKMQAGDVDGAIAVYEANPGVTTLANNLAWHLLRYPEHRPRALELVRLALDKPTSANLHTAAVAQALAGRPDRVASYRLQMLQSRPHRSTQPAEWNLVDGLVLHDLGLHEAARDAFSKLPPAEYPGWVGALENYVPASYR